MYYEKFNTAGIGGSGGGGCGDAALIKSLQAQHQQNLGDRVASGGSSNLQAGDSFEDQVPYCVYCRNDGHRVHECPIKRGEF